MVILADESVEKPVVEALRNSEYTVLYIAEMSPSITDEEVLATANMQNALLLTGDKDFGDLVYRQRLISKGVCLMGLAGLPTTAKVDMIVTVFDQHGKELVNSFSVISPNNLRIRKKP